MKITGNSIYSFIILDNSKMKLYSIWRHCRYSKPSIVILAFNPLKVLERPEQGQPNNFKEDYENYDSLSVSQKLDLAFRQGRKHLQPLRCCLGEILQNVKGISHLRFCQSTS